MTEGRVRDALANRAAYRDIDVALLGVERVGAEWTVLSGHFLSRVRGWLTKATRIAAEGYRALLGRCQRPSGTLSRS